MLEDWAGGDCMADLVGSRGCAVGGGNWGFTGRTGAGGLAGAGGLEGAVAGGEKGAVLWGGGACGAARLVG